MNASHLFSLRTSFFTRSGRGGGLAFTHHGLSAIDTKSAHGVQRHEVLGKRWLLSILVATAMRKEVADSNLYECQPPLPAKAPLSSFSLRGGCLSTVMSSHLSTGLPITHHGLSAIDTKSAHGVRRHEVLGKRWLLSILVATATSPSSPHLSTGFLFAHHGLSVIDTKSAHGVLTSCHLSHFVPPIPLRVKKEVGRSGERGGWLQPLWMTATSFSASPHLFTGFLFAHHGLTVYLWQTALGVRCFA
jgi:hypothetical protein